MKDTVLYQRNATNGGRKQMGTYNTAENGRGAWVALCAHPTQLMLEALSQQQKRGNSI
jgi:hypothetical protein